MYGHSYPHGAEAAHLAFYERHNREVRRFFAAHNASDVLLEACWGLGAGWGTLCGFLELPVPDVPFPHANRASQPIRRDYEQENRRRIEHQLQSLAGRNTSAAADLAPVNRPF